MDIVDEVNKKIKVNIININNNSFIQRESGNSEVEVNHWNIPNICIY